MGSGSSKSQSSSVERPRNKGISTIWRRTIGRRNASRSSETSETICATIPPTHASGTSETSSAAILSTQATSSDVRTRPCPDDEMYESLQCEPVASSLDRQQSSASVSVVYEDADCPQQDQAYDDTETQVKVYDPVGYVPASMRERSVIKRNTKRRLKTVQAATRLSLTAAAVDKPVTRVVAPVTPTHYSEEIDSIDDNDPDTESFSVYVDGGVYRWKSMTIITPKEDAIGGNKYAEERTGVYGNTPTLFLVNFGISSNSWYFPALAEGFYVLGDTIVHCSPHGQTFRDPLYVTLPLPDDVIGDEYLSIRVHVYYSDTNEDEKPRWKPLRRSHRASSREVRFDDSLVSDYEERNQAFMSADGHEISLALCHFCIFCVVIDGRELQAREASIKTWVKYCNGNGWSGVDVVVLCGCNEQKMTEREHEYVGYKGVPTSSFKILNTGGDVEVKLENTGIDWIKDAVMHGEDCVIHQKGHVWEGVTTSNFHVRSKESALSEDGTQFYFFAKMMVTQHGVKDVSFNVSIDLREVASARNSRPAQAHSTRTAPFNTSDTPTPFESSFNLNLRSSNSSPSNVPQHHGASSASSDLRPMPSNLPALGCSERPPPAIPPRTRILEGRKSCSDESQPLKTVSKVGRRHDNGDRMRRELDRKFRCSDHS